MVIFKVLLSNERVLPQQSLQTHQLALLYGHFNGTSPKNLMYLIENTQTENDRMIKQIWSIDLLPVSMKLNYVLLWITCNTNWISQNSLKLKR